MANIYKKEIPVNIPLIDSLSLKIPLAYCEVIDKRLTSLTAVYYDSLDAVDCELQPPKPVVVVKNGITCRFSLCEIPNTEREPIKYINLTVSAKLLKERYFEGINKNTIEVLHKTFLDFEVFTCDLETFKGGIVSDIDICLNRYVERPQIFSDIVHALYSQAGVKQKYMRLFGDEKNIGLNFNERRSAKPSLPFIKAYYKELELLHKSAEFFETFLQDYREQIKGLTRIEATIRNYAHKRRLDKYNILPMFRSLEDLLNLEEKDLYKFLCFSVASYIEVKPRIKAPNLSPTEHIIFELLQNCMEKGYDYKSLLCVVDSFHGSTEASTEVARSRMRKKITNLYDLLIHKDLKIKAQEIHNNHVLEYLRYLKIEV